jgi:60 kDa SS-A/Ro ribonucleoprotein
MRTTSPKVTHGGAKASSVGYEEQLRRSVMACMLWEDNFYESGIEISKRIGDLISKVPADRVAAIAIQARTVQKLRHVPLLIAREMARLPVHKGQLGTLLPEIIQRPDELAEFLAIYWKDGKCPIAAQVKKGLAAAFGNFNEYSLAKYDNQNNAIKLKDVLFLCHAKPAATGNGRSKKYTRKYKDGNEKVLLRHPESLYGKLVAGTLQTPDTWETELSGGADKRATFERLMTEQKLGALAFIRNLRNMEQSGVDIGLIREYAKIVQLDRVLPFRFISAARAVPRFESIIEDMMLRCVTKVEKLKGKTILIVDTSGSMHGKTVSTKSDLTRLDAAGALAILIREIAEEPVVYATAGDDGKRIHATMEVPARRGFALGELFANMRFIDKIGQGGIFLKQCMDYVGEKEKFEAARVIVITDEQDCSRGPGSKCDPDEAEAFGDENYIINVAPDKNGIGYGKWTHISGWSEAIIDYIRTSETV